MSQFHARESKFASWLREQTLENAIPIGIADTFVFTRPRA